MFPWGMEAMSIKCFFRCLTYSREVEQAMVVMGEKMLLLLQSVSRVGTYMQL